MQNKEICGEKSVNEKNVEVFNRYFPGCLSIENDNKLTLDVGRLKALLGDFSEIKEEGYGLDFVGKKIALNQAFKKNNKILKPLNKSTSKHILIKGDNLDALKILRQSYSEKIKMIYIDPPYNTKNDNFIYGDDFSQSNEEVLKTLDYSKEKLDYIKNLFGSKCHSGWLSFMYPRLLLARDLLKQDGVIFISIDDNECANLKILCDEIFGERNFVADFIRKTKSTTNDAKTGVNYQHEFLLCYAKNKEFVNLLGGEKNLENYKNLDNDPNGAWTSGNPTKPGYAKIQNFPLTNPYTKAIEYPPEGRSWVFTEKTIQNFINERRLVFKKEHKENERIFIYKHYLKDLKTTQKTFDSLIFSDNCYMNQAATKELLNLGMGEYFTYPKGVDFMAKIVEHATEKGDIILDFFAGSGTTAHAVLESNKSDYQKLSEGGGLFNGLNAAFKERRFILVQLDEKIDPKNKSAYDFCLNILKSESPSIFDITEERIKRAGAKIKEACPNLDVGFRAFEIIDDETHANDKNLSQAHQKDLFAYSNPKKWETQTILIKLLGCEGLELTTPIICLIENALYLALNTAFIVGDIEMSEVLENLKDKGVEKISMYMPAISNDRLCLELGSNLNELHLESGDLKIRG